MGLTCHIRVSYFTWHYFSRFHAKNIVCGLSPCRYVVGQTFAFVQSSWAVLLHLHGKELCERRIEIRTVQRMVRIPLCISPI